MTRRIVVSSFCSILCFIPDQLLCSSKEAKYGIIRAKAGETCVVPGDEVFAKEDIVTQYKLMLKSAYNELSLLRSKELSSIDERFSRSRGRTLSQKNLKINTLKGKVDAQVWDTIINQYEDDVSVLKRRIADLDQQFSDAFARSVDRSRQVLEYYNLNLELQAQSKVAQENISTLNNKLEELSQIIKKTENDNLECQSKVEKLTKENQKLEERAVRAENSLKEYISSIEQLNKKVKSKE